MSGPVFRYGAQTLRDHIAGRRARYAKALDLEPRADHAAAYQQGIDLFDELLGIIDERVAALPTLTTNPRKAPARQLRRAHQ